jgi:hypothetical protein
MPDTVLACGSVAGRRTGPTPVTPSVVAVCKDRCGFLVGPASRERQPVHRSALMKMDGSAFGRWTLMIRTILFALFLSLVPLTCFGQRIVEVAPTEEFAVRLSLRDREELKPFAAEYQRTITTRLKPLGPDQVTNVFGQKLESIRNLTPHGLTNSVALPSFAPDSVLLSGLLVTNDQSHADLYAVGDVGYIEFIYQWDGSTEYARIVLYFRPDASFVPLKNADDFSRRLEWEKPKWQALQEWLDVHVPKPAKRGQG